MFRKPIFQSITQFRGLLPTCSLPKAAQGYGQQQEQQTLNLKKEETVVIEDSPVGIEAARRAGLMIICRREERLPLDQSGADWYVDDLSEIIGIIE